MNRWISTALVALSAVVAPALRAQAPLVTVPMVDLGRYSGDWYEYARTPNTWENICARDVVVHYAMKPDGGMALKNDCIKKDGSLNRSSSSAKVVDKATGARLKVTFFWPLTADYWIIGLDPNYQWAVVGQPDRKYLWVLSRTASLSPATDQQIRRIIANSGYDVNQVAITTQDGVNSLTGMKGAGQ